MSRRWPSGVPRLPRLRHPAQIVVAGFALAIGAGTVLLLLPVARAGDGGASVLEALFTATSAVCVTGLIVVDTPSYWSGSGEAVLLALIQVGGFGIMTLASLLALLVSRRLGLRSRLTAAAETKSLAIGDVRTVVFGVARVSLIFEAITAALLTARFAVGYDEPLGRAAYLGVSMRSRRSTTRASPCSATASWDSSRTRGSACPSPQPSSSAASGSEVRGDPAVSLFDRRVDGRVQRQALTVALLAIGAVVGATVLLVNVTRLPTDQIMFEVVSAFATVGLSTGITTELPPLGQSVLIVLMFLGRLGPSTLVSALALREHRRRYQFPEGRPIIG